MEKREEICSEEISVIVQGPVTFYTVDCCISIRKYLPHAEIILSTWKESEVGAIDYDKLVLNEDPGNFTFILSEKMDNGSSLYPMNINRQIVSTLNGLKRATRRYSCKMRSDMVLTGTGFVSQFILHHADIVAPYSEILNHRMVTLPAANPKRWLKYPFYLCDWFYFGLTSDLLSVWDQPLIDNLNGPSENGNYFMSRNFSNEQYIWLGFLKKIIDIKIGSGSELTPALLEASERSFANCCIFLTASEAGIKNLKIGASGYGAEPYFSNAGLYTIREWRKMYSQCGGKNFRCNIALNEELIFWIVKRVRMLKNGKFNGVYAEIRKYYHCVYDKHIRRKSQL